MDPVFFGSSTCVASPVRGLVTIRRLGRVVRGEDVSGLVRQNVRTSGAFLEFNILILILFFVSNSVEEVS